MPLITPYHARDNLLHRLDPRTKLLWFLAMSVLSIATRRPELLAAGIALVILISLAAGLDVRRFWPLVQAMIPVTFAVVILQLIYAEGPVFATLGPLDLHTRGFAIAFSVMFRIILIVTVCLQFFMWVHPTDLALTFVAFGLPYRYALLFGLSLRTFPVLERVRVQVHRTAERGNPVLTLIAPIFGVDDVDINATATAEAVPANAGTCIKPWAVPDKWNEVHTPPWDENNDEFNAFYDTGNNKGDPLPNPDIYVPVDQEGYTGFQQAPQGPDYGRQILLKPGNPKQAINSSHFFPIALTGGTGADWYRENIPGCWPDVAVIGQMIAVEPGNMTGPTSQGTEELIAKDPGAYWDEVNDVVVSDYKPSPRIVVLPVFDPFVYDDGRVHGRIDIKVANLVGFFIEDMIGNSVLGRIVPMTGLIRPGGAGGVPPGSFLRAIRLVE